MAGAQARPRSPGELCHCAHQGGTSRGGDRGKAAPGTPAMQAPGLRGRGSGPAGHASPRPARPRLGSRGSGPAGASLGPGGEAGLAGGRGSGAPAGQPGGGPAGGGPAAGARRGAAPAACCPGVNGAVGSWAGAWKGRVSSKCISGRRRGGGGLGVGVEFGTCPNPRGKKGVEESPAKPRCLLTPSSPLLLSVVWIFLPFFLGSAFFPTSSYLNEQTHTMKTQWAFWRIFRPTNAVL